MADDTLPATATPGPLAKVDGRTRLVQTAKRTRMALTQALGGASNVTPQQAIAIRMIAEAEALRQSLFAEAANGVPVAVADFAGLAAVGQRGLKLIGMKRRARDVTLADVLEGRAGPPESAQATRSPSGPARPTGGAA